MNFITSDNSRFVRLAYVALAFLVAVLYDQLFWDKAHGLGAFLLVVFYVVGFTTLAYYTKYFKNRLALLLLIPILILAFDQMLYNNELVTGLVPFVIFVLLIIYSILLTLRNENKFIFYFKSIPVVRNVGIIFKNIATVFHDLLSWTGKEKHNEKYKQIAIGLVISIPVLLLFTLLFASADEVFGSGLEKLFSIKIDFDYLVAWRIIKIGIITFIFGAFFYSLISDSHVLKDNTKSVKKISETIATVMLILVNILFAIFVFIQIKYLFGSHDFVISQRIVFAEYARNGFFQLVWVMIFSALLILAFYRSTSHHGKNILVSILKLILIAQVFVIAVSALKRMNLYQAEYGYTTLRLYVEWFIYFICLMFTLLAIAIIKHYTFKNFFYAGLVGGLVAFTIVASINVDGIIAKRNVERYLVENKNLDFYYLIYQLSDDAVPEIIRLNENINTAKITFVIKPEDVRLDSINKSNIFTVKNDYNLMIKDKRDKILNQITHWYSFNIGAQTALDSLNNIK